MITAPRKRSAREAEVRHDFFERSARATEEKRNAIFAFAFAIGIPILIFLIIVVQAFIEEASR